MNKKLIIFDIDGTAVEARPDALPSERLIRAVEQLQLIEGIHLACATGRTYPWAKVVTDALGLRTPCIVSAGTQIIEPSDGSEIWSKRLTSDAVEGSLRAIKDAGLNPRILTETDTPDTAKRANEITVEPYLLLDVQDIEPEQVDELIANIKAVSEVEIAKVNSPNQGYTNLHITDRQATKEHAVEELRKMLDVDIADTYGVGDGHNDIHLFKSVGVKVAMGNAVPELKQAADIVIGSLSDDGLAVYLESLIQGRN